MGIDAFLFKALGKVFKMLFPFIGLGSVVISDQDGVLIHAQVPFQAAEQVPGKVDRVPLVKRRAQALAQLVDGGLSHQRHGHLAQTDVEVEGASAFPTQILVEAVELLDMPTVGELGRQGRDFRASAGASEALEVIVLGPLAGALNVTVARLGQGAAPWLEGLARDSKTGPVRGEGTGRQSSVVELQSFCLAQWDQQIKRGVAPDIVQEFPGEVFHVGDDQGPWAL